MDWWGRGHGAGDGAARPRIRDKTLSRPHRRHTRVAQLSRGLIGVFKEQRHLTPQTAIDKGFGFFSVRVCVCV